MLKKYQIIKVLGQSDSSIVYLAEHKTLQENRVVKCLRKDNGYCRLFLNEVKLLKSLKHPSVPILYDFEEDEDNCYIIEEYISGKSFRQLFSGDNIKAEDILKYFIMLSDFFVNLHERKPYPVLYLDLKPEHIICGKAGIHLLDFGASVELKNSMITGNCGGTMGFAAPELTEGEFVDERADIYSLGAVFYWCLTGHIYNGVIEDFNESYIQYSKTLKRILEKCLEENKEYRYKSVRELLKDLQGMFNSCEVKKSSYRIAVIGSQSRIGVTHFCVALTCYLNSINKKSIYEEKTDAAFLSVMCENNEEFVQRQGIVVGRFFYGLPKYGRTVSFGNISYDVHVQDYGYLSEQVDNGVKTADLCIVLGGLKEWEINYTGRAIRLSEVGELNGNCRIVIVGTERNNKRYRNVSYRKKIYYMPYNANPFRVQKDLRHFFDNLMKDVFNNKELGEKSHKKIKRSQWGAYNYRNNG